MEMWIGLPIPPSVGSGCPRPGNIQDNTKEPSCRIVFLTQITRYI
nr:MAG TPA: hypothetical protein [Caudoviricetes sp.]DAR50402.1 MAG TPA: hypothetical protein [Caudoviricetes sp.]